MINPVNANLETKFESLVNLLEEHVDEVVDKVFSRAKDEIPEYEWAARQPELEEAGRTFSKESILAEFAAFKRNATLPDVCPSVDAENARRAAQMGAPLNLLLYGFRISHLVQWETWFELVEQHEADPAAQRFLLERGSRFFLAYADRLTRFVAHEYTREREQSVRSYEQRRVHLVRDLLDGGDVDATALNYEVDLNHIGLIAWGSEAADAVRDLAKRLDRRLLIVSVLEETWWAWLGRDRGLDGQSLRALEKFRPPAGTRFAVGGEAGGVEGFRRTHGQAVSALRVARRNDTPVTHFDDVALVTLAGQDEAEAQVFVAQQLRGLDGDDVRSRRLRETLEAYFAAGHNAATAAAALGVHEQTVAHRLRAVEERIGRPVATRRAELETALRLRRYLSQPSSPADEGLRS